MNPQAVTHDPFQPNDVLVGTHRVYSLPGVIKSGEAPLKRGALLGYDGDGKLRLSAAASEDGSQVPAAVLVHDADASAADAPCTVYLAGDFDARLLITGAGINPLAHRRALAALGIYVHDTVSG